MLSAPGCFGQRLLSWVSSVLGRSPHQAAEFLQARPVPRTRYLIQGVRIVVAVQGTTGAERLVHDLKLREDALQRVVRVLGMLASRSQSSLTSWPLDRKASNGLGQADRVTAAEWTPGS